MPPFLQAVKSFADVPITDDGVDTVVFLEAADGVVKLFDLLNNPAFLLVTNDLNGNIKRVRDYHNTHPADSRTLQLLILHENNAKDGTATEGLMWLLRGFAFTFCALRHSRSCPDEELSQSFRVGYERSLKQYHNFVVKGVFTVACKACPARSTFYTKLASDPDGGPPVLPDKLNEDIDTWLTALKDILEQMQKFYQQAKCGEIPDVGTL